MKSHSRETAHFSQMDATMRQLGSWTPRGTEDGRS